VYRASGDRFLGHGFHSTSLPNQSGESSDVVRVGPPRKVNLDKRNQLPDGRLVSVGGEHEDYYDPDFCIYNVSLSGQELAC